MAPSFSFSTELIIDFKEDIFGIFPPRVGIFIVPCPMVCIIRMGVDERHCAVLRRDDRRMVEPSISLEVVANDIAEIEFLRRTNLPCSQPLFRARQIPPH